MCLLGNEEEPSRKPRHRPGQLRKLRELSRDRKEVEQVNPFRDLTVIRAADVNQSVWNVTLRILVQA